MKKACLFLALMAVAPLVAVNPAAAQRPGTPASGARGGFSLSVHTHSSQFQGPSGAGTLFPTDPLPTPITEGSDFSYSSIPCSRPAPFNDRSLSFDPDYPGIQDPASTRHFIQGTLTKLSPRGDRGRIEGTLTTILCRNGQESQDRISFAFRGRFHQTSENEMRVTGRYWIIGGTGTFQDLTGRGSINGSITCLPITLTRTGAESCADLGVFSDAVFSLEGTYADPTVPTR